jgi:hypothetical protein
VRVVCVLRSGPTYGPEYVYRLQAGVLQHLPGAQFICLTDTPDALPGVKCVPLIHAWQGWWSKMELFRPDLTGDLLYFDLDTVICGDLTGIAAVGRDTFIRDFYRRGQCLGSGMMYLTEMRRAKTWATWMRHPARWMQRYQRGGDQSFLETIYAGTCARWQDQTPGQVVSYKAHCARGLPVEARVVCYHGLPKPHQTGWATHGSIDKARAG